MAKPEIQVVAAVIEHDGRYLITQRRANAVLAGLWEFPGGKVEPHETQEEALVRECRGRLGVQVAIADKLGTHIHEYTHYTVSLTMFACRIPNFVQPRAVGVEDLRWVTSEEMLDYDFPAADEKTMDKLLGLFTN